MCPGSGGVRLLGFTRSRGVEPLVLDECEHAQGAVPSSSVVEDFKVLEQGVGQLYAGLPPPPAEQLGVHPTPERLDDRVVDAPIDRKASGSSDEVASDGFDAR